MELKNRISSILTKEMDRKGFIKHLAVGALAVIGGGLLLRVLSLNNDRGSERRVPMDAYGDVTYGGARPRTGRAA